MRQIEEKIADLAEFGFFNQRILGKTIQFPLIKEYIARETNRFFALFAGKVLHM